MNIKSLAFLACRLFALYLVSQIFVWFVYIYNGSNLPPTLTAGQYSWYSIYPLGSLALALLFWWKAEWVAAKIAGSHAADAMSGKLTGEDIQTAGFAIVGMYLLAEAIPGIALNISMMLDPVKEHHHSMLLPYTIRFCGMLVLGIWLVFGASWFTNIIRKAHALDLSAGMSKLTQVIRKYRGSKIS